MKTNNPYNKNIVFAASCIGMLLFGIVMISLGSILPDIKEKFQLDDASIGQLTTVLPFGILVGSLLFGPLVDWLSYKIIIVAGAILTSMGLLGIASMDIFILLNVAVLCIGVGGGILNGVTNALVSEISDGNQSADLSYLGVFFGVGALSTPLVLGLCKDIYSFEIILLSLMTLNILIVLLFLVISFPISKESKGISSKEGIKMLSDPLLLLLGFTLFFQSGLEGLTNNWSTSYFDKVKTIDGPNALFALSAFVVSLTVSRLILGKLLRMYKSFNVMIICSLIALLGFILMYIGNDYWSIVIAMIAVGFGLAAAFPIILGFVGQLYTRHMGTAFSIVITIALIGNVLANFLMGQFVEKIGLTIFPYFLITGIVAILLLLGVINKHNKLKNN